MAEGGTALAQTVAAREHWLNAERVRVYSWIIVVIFGVVLAGWVAMAMPDLVDRRGKPLGYDFMAYWSTGRLALAGQAATAFEGQVITAVQHAAVPFNPQIWFPWHYPPTFLFLATPLALLPYPAALALFVFATGALYALLVRSVLPDRRAWIVAAATPAALINLLDGQNAFLTVALAGFALLWLDRRPVASGILIGLLALKPHLAILFPLALLAEGRWRTIVWAASTVLLLMAASVAAFGWSSWAVFLEHLPVSQAMADAGAVPWGTMPSPYVFILSLGGSVTAARILQALVALFAAACVWRAWRRKDAPFEAKAPVLMTASLLVSPYLFYYDLLWAALAVAWLTQLGLRDGCFHRGEREILLFAWAVPVIMQPLQLLTGIQPAFPALLLLLLAAVCRAAPLRRRETEILHSAVELLRTAHWLDRERVVRWGWGFVGIAIAVLGWDFFTHTTLGVTSASGEHLGRDFVNYWSGARLGIAGDASRAYDPDFFNSFEKSLIGPQSEFKLYSYPPIAMLLTLPLVAVPFMLGWAAWSLLGIASCAAALSRLVELRIAVMVSICAPAAILDLQTGQNGHFTAALMGGGLLLLERRPVFAGICFGLLSYKPQLGVLLPVALIAGRYWRAFAAAAMTVCLLIAASALILGPDSWHGFAGQMEIQQKLMQVNDVMWHRTQTVFLSVRMLGASVPAAYALQTASTILAATAVFLAWRGRASFGIKAAILVVGAFLATPYAWDYDMVVLVFAAVWLALEGMATGFRPWERLAVLLLLAQPGVTLNLTDITNIQIAPLGLWFAFAVLFRRGCTMITTAPADSAAPSHTAALVGTKT